MTTHPDAHFDRQYQTHLKLKGLQPKTIDAYARAIRRLGGYFDHQIDDLSEARLTDYFSDLIESHSWSAVKLVQHQESSYASGQFSEARNGLKRVIDQVVDDADYTIISRRDAPDAVVMSLDTFNSMMETLHLMKTPANAAHLARSIEQFRSGQTSERGLVDA
jgi:antitoxin YefM